MEKDPNRRYQSADDLRADLLRFERGRPLVGGPVLRSPPPEPPVPAVVPVTPAPLPVATQPTKPTKRWGAIITVGIAFALLLVLIGVLLLQSDIGSESAAKPTADVPLVIGKQFAEAEAVLTAQKLKVVRVETASDQAPDQVLDQQPESGSKVNVGSAVTLTVSSTTITMPDIVGKTREEAFTALQAAKLTGNFVDQDSADKAPGTVLSTLPAAGEKIQKPPAGQPSPVVTVNVAKEPPVAVPDVRGQDPVAATSTLAQAGFLTVQRVNTSSDSVPQGRVVGTNPSAGTPTQKGETIQLLVSTGPNLIEVPNTVGQSRDEAASALTDLGFNVTIVSAAGPPTSKGKVIAQSPPGGSMKRLENVTITVGI
jgi:serine/threonine-protein kinase